MADLFSDDEPHAHRHRSPSVPHPPAAPIRVYGARGRQQNQPPQDEPSDPGGGDDDENFKPAVDLIHTKDYLNISKIAE